MANLNKFWLIGIVFIILLSSFVIADLTDSIDANWDFNTDSSSQTDNTGNGNTLTESGAMDFEPMVISNGIYNDGSAGNYFTASTNLIGTGSKSFAWWSNSSDTTVLQVLFDNDIALSGNQNGVRVLYADVSGGKLVASIRNGVGSGEYLELQIPAASNTIDHWCMVFNASAPFLKVYKNGVIAGTDSSTSGSEVAGTNNFRIAAEADAGAGRELDGSIDEFSAWTRPLSGDECLEIYNIENGGDPYPWQVLFELNARNLFNTTNLLSFTANIDNGTTSQTISTTNGSIFWPKNQIVDIEVSATDYLNVTYTNINTSTDYVADIWQSELRVTANDSIYIQQLSQFNITINDSVYTLTNNSLQEAAFKVNAGTYSYSATNENYQSATTGIFTVTAANLQNETVEFSRDTTNFVNFFDLRTMLPIQDANVTVVYPNGVSINRTTDSKGYINFSVINNGTAQDGNLQIIFQDFSGYITPITFTPALNVNTYPLNESYGISDANIIVNVYDRETTTLLTGVDVTVSLLTYGSQTTNNGTVNFNNITLAVGDIVVQATASGYITEQQTVVYTGQENATLNLYLLNATGPNTGLLFASVVDENFRTQSNATVELYEYNNATNSYIKISEIRSNINGEAVFAIELNVKTYYLSASKIIDGFNYVVTSTPEIIKTDNEVRNLILRIIDEITFTVTDKLVITVTESFTNNISTIGIDYTTLDNFVATVCVEYLNTTNDVDTSVYLQCVNSSAAYVATPILLNRDFSYVGQVYQLLDGEKLIIQEYVYPSIYTLDYLLQQYDYLSPAYVWFYIVLLGIALYTSNIYIFCVGAIIMSWIGFYNFPSVAFGAASVVKTFVLITMMNIARRKEDVT